MGEAVKISKLQVARKHAAEKQEQRTQGNYIASRVRFPSEPQLLSSLISYDPVWEMSRVE